MVPTTESTGSGPPVRWSEQVPPLAPMLVVLAAAGLLCCHVLCFVHGKVSHPPCGAYTMHPGRDGTWCRGGMRLRAPWCTALAYGRIKQPITKACDMQENLAQRGYPGPLSHESQERYERELLEGSSVTPPPQVGGNSTVGDSNVRDRERE